MTGGGRTAGEQRSLALSWEWGWQLGEVGQARPCLDVRKRTGASAQKVALQRPHSRSEAGLGFLGDAGDSHWERDPADSTAVLHQQGRCTNRREKGLLGSRVRASGHPAGALGLPWAVSGVHWQVGC